MFSARKRTDGFSVKGLTTLAKSNPEQAESIATEILSQPDRHKKPLRRLAAGIIINNGKRVRNFPAIRPSKIRHMLNRKKQKSLIMIIFKKDGWKGIDCLLGMADREEIILSGFKKVINKKRLKATARHRKWKSIEDRIIFIKPVPGAFNEECFLALLPLLQEVDCVT